MIKTKVKLTYLVPHADYIVPAGSERIDLCRLKSNDELEAKTVKDIKSEMDAQVAKLMGPTRMAATPTNIAQDARNCCTQYTSVHIRYHAINVHATSRN